MVNLDNSASVMLSFVDTASLMPVRTTQDTTFNQNSEALTTDAVISAASGVPGAQTNVQKYKTNMTNVIAWYKGKNAELETALKEGSVASTDYNAVFVAKKAEVEDLRKRVEEKREVEKIRQEQVASLDARGAANYHTSWLGLQKPMKEGSRFGLLVAAGFFALLAVLGFVFLYRNFAAQRPGFSFGVFSGGRYRRSGKE